MARYDKTSTNKKNKKNYYETTIYKKVEEKNSDLYFVNKQVEYMASSLTMPYMAIIFFTETSEQTQMRRCNDRINK